VKTTVQQCSLTATPGGMSHATAAQHVLAAAADQGLQHIKAYSSLLFQHCTTSLVAQPVPLHLLISTYTQCMQTIT